MISFFGEVDRNVIESIFDCIKIPLWLARRLGREPTEDESEAYMEEFFSTPVPARYKLVRPWGLWSPSAFMYWFTPEARHFLIREFVGGADCEIRISVAGLPVALDAFEFLVAAAADVDVNKVRVHGL